MIHLPSMFHDQSIYKQRSLGLCRHIISHSLFTYHFISHHNLSLYQSVNNRKTRSKAFRLCPVYTESILTNDSAKRFIFLNNNLRTLSFIKFAAHRQNIIVNTYNRKLNIRKTIPNYAEDSDNARKTTRKYSEKT